MDVDRDGDLDFVLGGRANVPSELYWFKYQAMDRWVPHLAGTEYQSDVELTALDVDRDGWIDLVCSGIWYRNSGQPREQPFERLVFAPGVGGAHDVLAADIDGDGRNDILMMGDPGTALKELVWYRIPDDPRRLWEPHRIGPSVHGAISPAGVADLDGDGDLDVVRADTWFENADGKGLRWTAHVNIPMGREGPFGICVRTVVTDLDGDGKQELVMCDADIADSRVAILTNVDGRGGQWSKQEIPLSFPCGSLHSLAVADFNNDGRPDVLVCEQEELLPAGRQDPRFVILENRGGQFASASFSMADSVDTKRWWETWTETAIWTFARRRGARSLGMPTEGRCTPTAWRTCSLRNEGANKYATPPARPAPTRPPPRGPPDKWWGPGEALPASSRPQASQASLDQRNNRAKRRHIIRRRVRRRWVTLVASYLKSLGRQFLDLVAEHVEVDGLLDELRNRKPLGIDIAIAEP